MFNITEAQQLTPPYELHLKGIDLKYHSVIISEQPVRRVLEDGTAAHEMKLPSKMDHIDETLIILDVNYHDLFFKKEVIFGRLVTNNKSINEIFQEQVVVNFS